MDQHQLEALTKRIEMLERRGRLAIVGLLLVAASLMIAFSAQRVHSANAPDTFITNAVPIPRWIDTETHVVCYSASQKLFCVHF
jgi:hypothetical protein